MKKTLSILLSILMAFGVCTMAVSAEAETAYTIINPYAAVDWDTWKTYKACLHTHTTASDGDVTLHDMVQAYYEQDYDILAITDHGVLNTGWRDDRQTYPLFNKFRKVEPMTEAEYQRITTGADRDGRGMIDITGGIECNMAVLSKTHVNGYFTDYGSGVWGTENDYKGATVAIEKAGGFSVLNHVGDWFNSHNFPERVHKNTFIAYFADIFTTSKSCIGMEIVNSRDNVSRADRAMWDELLQVVIPTGRNIWAFADDDSEQLYEVGRSFELFPLSENTEANVKTAMETGAFFSASRFYNTDRSNEFEGNGQVPLVQSITVNQADNTITVAVNPDRDCSSIEWIADGKVIATDYTIDLNDYENDLGCYVRFQLRGKGGVTYSQTFELQYEGRVDKPIPTSFFNGNPLGKVLAKLSKNVFVSLVAFILDKLGMWLGITP